MDSLPNCVVQYILSYISNATDVAKCKCVSKQWKDSLSCIRSLHFPRNSFDNYSGKDSPENVILKMISSTVGLEELVVYSQFSISGLTSWLSFAGQSLKSLDLRMDNLIEHDSCQGSLFKFDCISSAVNLSSLKLWAVLMSHYPNRYIFHKLQNLEIVGARLNDHALSTTLQACPNLTRLVLISGEGLGGSVEISLPNLEKCKFKFTGDGNCSLTLTSPKIESLDIQGCSGIKVPETKCLRDLSISRNSGRVHTVDFGKLEALEFLSMKGVQWCWDAISKMLRWASEVRHLFMKVEFTGDIGNLQPFPEVDLVEFFNSHPKLQKFDIHGAMFAALCQKNSLSNLDTHTGFVIPSLEEVALTVRSPLNAEQKLSTLKSLVKYGKRLKIMVIKIHNMSNFSSENDFYQEICKLRYMNRKIVRID